MKKIFEIANNELKSIFYSPIAWIILTVFLYLISADYFGTAVQLVGRYERGGAALAYCEYLTAALTSEPGAFLLTVISYLYLFFPLITMGLISREVNGGTIKLLTSSPVRIREIVLGKFFAVVIFTLALLSLICLIYINIAFNLFHPDLSQMLASLLGLFILFSTYAAIGLFISSLTSYQIVAAVITITLFMLFDKLGFYWQEIGIVREITFYLNLGGKSGNLIQGLYNLRDLSYFGILIFVFLCFTAFRLRSKIESVSSVKKIVRNLTVITAAFLLGYITSRPSINIYWDTTRNERLTITPQTQRTLARLNDGDLEVIAFVNLFRNYDRFSPGAQNRLINYVWEPYIRFKPDINFKFVYYYGLDSANERVRNNSGRTIEQIVERDARSRNLPASFFVAADSVKKYVDVASEDFDSFFLLRYKGKQMVLRIFDDLPFWPSEDEVAAAISKLVDTIPAIVFSTGKIERSPYLKRQGDYNSIMAERTERHSLVNQGYLLDTVSLDRKEVFQKIAALVIADPRVPYTPEALHWIDNYIKDGGNLFIACEPDKKAVIQPVLDMVGIRLKPGMLLQSNRMFSSDLVYGYLTDSAIHMAPQLEREIADRRYYGDSVFRVALGGASAMEITGREFKVTPLLYSDPTTCWNRLEKVDQDSIKLALQREPTDETGKFLVAVKLERMVGGKLQRIIVVSDADFLTPALRVSERPRRLNFSFGFWCFGQFSYGRLPANTLRPKSIDNGFRVKVSQFERQKIYYFVLIPALLIISGTVILIKRRRR
jgi:ABC-2 type transport system permease protein